MKVLAAISIVWQEDHDMSFSWTMVAVIPPSAGWQHHHTHTLSPHPVGALWTLIPTGYNLLCPHTEEVGGTLKCQADGMGFAIKRTSYTRYRVVSFSFCSFVGSFFSLQGNDLFFSRNFVGLILEPDCTFITFYTHVNKKIASCFNRSLSITWKQTACIYRYILFKLGMQDLFMTRSKRVLLLVRMWRLCVWETERIRKKRAISTVYSIFNLLNQHDRHDSTSLLPAPTTIARVSTYIIK